VARAGAVDVGRDDFASRGGGHVRDMKQSDAPVFLEAGILKSFLKSVYVTQNSLCLKFRKPKRFDRGQLFVGRARCSCDGGVNLIPPPFLIVDASDVLKSRLANVIS
jgi:hypothetical protein